MTISELIRVSSNLLKSGSKLKSGTTEKKFQQLGKEEARVYIVELGENGIQFRGSILCPIAVIP